MATTLETPSRIWRRIEAIEHRDMPSLPSLPPFEDSGEVDDSQAQDGANVELIDDDGNPSLMHSTATAQHTTSFTYRGLGGNNTSTPRFGNSIASISSKSSNKMTRRSQSESLDNQSLLDVRPAVASNSDEEGIESKSTVPEAYLPPDEDEQQTSFPDFSLADALESVSREGSPPLIHGIMEDTPRKNYDYSVSLRSEPKASPLEKYRHVALRKTNPRARTPSLSRSSSSESSSPGHSTPQSNCSLTLPESRSNSPISSPDIRPGSALSATHGDVGREALQDSNLSHFTQETRSMDITDVHISPPRLDGDFDGPTEAASLEKRSQHNEQEPTFSSEGDPTPYVIHNNAHMLGTGNVSQSIASTPTPALPRHRARFNIPSPPTDLLSTPRSDGDSNQTPRQEIVPATPYNRPSFLLSVINSTTRPRMTAGTPFPRRQATPSVAESTPAARRVGNDSSPATNPRPAFVGVIRRPRIALASRMSHPLSQAISSAASSESEPAIEGDDAPWETPSPYDGMSDKASFISTASSHDLTTHQRVNTSFDPAMGFGAGAPVGRFNANKLNTYLHGLNRRLQEENEALVERLKEFEEERKTFGDTSKQAAEISSRRLSKGSQRRSSVGTALGDVKEDMAEGWLEEKAELEEMIEKLQAEAKNWVAEKEGMEKKLQHELEERDRDKLRWKERMMEAQEGVAELVTSLENRVAKSEEEARRGENEASRKVKEMEKALAEVEGERIIATERALKAEKLLEDGKELGGALAGANKRIAQVLGDLKTANLQIKGLEEEVMQSDRRIDELEKVQKEQKGIISSLEAELAQREDSISADHDRIGKLEQTIRQTDQQLHEAKTYTEVLEEGINEAGDQIHKLEKELAAAHETINRINIVEQQNLKEIEYIEKELHAARKREHQLEEVVEEVREKMTQDQEIILDLKNRLASLERERSTISSRDTFRSSSGIVYTAAEYEALEQELDETNKEKARLRALLDQSPARKAIEKAKELKIELLEREKEELLERNRALRATMNEFSTPNKVINNGISPIHRHVLNMSMRMPKTPGAPLRDMSWLNNTQRDASVTPLVSEIQRLQGELDRANESIDDKLDKLEDAGLGVVGLTEKLEDARMKIIALEDEIASLRRKEERRTRRLARARCQKCHIKLNLDSITHDESSVNVSNDPLPTEPPTPPTRTSETLKANLQTVNEHLEELKRQWETEKTRLLGEKAVLEDAANRLNGQIKTTKSEAKRASEGARAIAAAKGNIQDELSKAKETIAVLERELSSERSRLRSMASEQGRMQREKKQIMTDMQRTEGDIDDVKQQMQMLKKENQRLEKELRENAVAEQKARLFEARVSENADTIEQLRQERSILAAEYKDLQSRFQDVTEVTNKLRNTCSSLTTAHDNHRHELDLHRQEIEDLRKVLEERKSDLQKVEQEKEKVLSEKENVARTVAALEADLKRVKRDAEAFGRDLDVLRAEKEMAEAKSKDEIAKAEREKMQAQAQIRILNEQLTAEKERASRTNNGVSAVEEDKVASLKIQHSKECKGLMVQIRYLKAKFTRESVFRDGLSYQKQYLMVLLQQFETSERNIFAAIARIGFPSPPPPPPRTRLKLRSVCLMLVFLSRVKQSSDAWKQEGAAKKLLATALDDVRKKRVAKVD